MELISSTGGGQPIEYFGWQVNEPDKGEHDGLGPIFFFPPSHFTFNLIKLSLAPALGNYVFSPLYQKS